MSISNFDFEQLRNLLIAIAYFAAPVFAGLGVFYWIDRAINARRIRKEQAKKKAEAEADYPFFFGSVSDWGEWK